MPTDACISDEVLAVAMGGVITVTINRAAKRNALSLNVLRRLREVFSEYAREPTSRLAILTGAGDQAFASGGDVAEFMEARSPADARRISDTGRAALDAIRSFPVPVVARLNGLALGGGAELALACDLRYAAAGAGIGFIHAKLGISPSWGGGIDLMRLVGAAAGMRLLASEEVLNAQAAHEIGLVDGVATPEESLEVAFATFTERMRRQPPQVMQAIKSLARTERLRERAAADAEEMRHFVETWTHPDHWTALASVMEQRRRSK